MLNVFVAGALLMSTLAAALAGHPFLALFNAAMMALNLWLGLHHPLTQGMEA